MKDICDWGPQAPELVGKQYYIYSMKSMWAECYIPSIIRYLIIDFCEKQSQIYILQIWSCQIKRGSTFEEVIETDSMHQKVMYTVQEMILGTWSKC